MRFFPEENRILCLFQDYGISDFTLESFAVLVVRTINVSSTLACLVLTSLTSLAASASPTPP